MYIHCDDGSYPIKSNGATTGGGGVDINWTEPTYATPANGSGVTAQDKTDIAAEVMASLIDGEAFSSVIEGMQDQIDRLTFDGSDNVHANVQAGVSTDRLSTTPKKTATEQRREQRPIVIPN